MLSFLLDAFVPSFFDRVRKHSAGPEPLQVWAMK